jgi:hypothetical protein
MNRRGARRKGIDGYSTIVFWSRGVQCSVSRGVKIVPLIAAVGQRIPMFDMGRKPTGSSASLSRT